MDFNFTFYDQNEIPTSGNIITCIRDGLSSVPAISRQTGYAGIGGSGVGPHYHNITYLSIKSLNSSYPKGSKVTEAQLNLQIAKHDYKISTTWTFTACGNISNTLSGVNKPKLYSKTITQSGFTVSGTSYNVDITDLMQYLIDNRLNTIQISAPRGNNRKYIYAPSITATINKQPSSLSFACTTDCWSTSSNTYAYNSITVNANSSTSGVYFQYKLKDVNNVVQYTSSWTTKTSYTFTDLSKFSNRSQIKVEVSGSLTSTPTTSSIYTPISSVISIYKMDIPSYDITVSKSPSVNGWTTGGCYYVESQSAYVCNQSAKIELTNLTYYGIKQSTNPTIRYYIDNKEVSNNNNLFNFGSDDKAHQFKVVINNGFTSCTKSVKIIDAKPLSYNLTGDLAKKTKVPCDTNDKSFTCTVVQNSLLPSTNYALTSTITNTSTSEVIATRTQSSNNSLTSTMTPNIQTYETNTNLQFSISFKNIIGQTLSGVLQTSVINRKPNQLQNISLTRSTTDIFNRNSYSQDINADYTSFSIPPNDTYTLSYDKATDVDNDNLIYRIYNGNTLISTTPSLQYSNVYQTSAGTQNTSIGICAYDGYNESDRTNFDIRNVASLPTPNINNIVVTTSIKGEESDYNSPVNNVLYKYINIAVPNISDVDVNNNTKTNELRFGYKILDTDKNNLVIQEGTSEPNSIDSSSKLFTKITLNNKITNSEHIQLQIYYIDRFNLTSSYVTTSTYTIYQSPQYRLYGTQGVGYRWLLTNESNPSSGFFGNSKLPVFYGSIKNPNNVNYTLVVHLYKDDTTTWIGNALLNYPQENSTYDTTTYPYYNTRLTIAKNATTYFKFNKWLESPSHLDSSVISSLSNGSYYVVFAIYEEAPFTQTLANTNLVELSPISDDYKFIISDTYDFNGKTWSLNDFQQNQVITASHLNVLNDYVKRVYNSYSPIDSDLFTPDVYRDLTIYADANSTGVPTVDATFTTKFGNLVSIPSSTTSPNNLCDSTPISHTTSTYVSKYCKLDNSQSYLQVSVPIKCTSTTNINSLLNQDWGASKHFIRFYDEYLNEIPSISINPYVAIPSVYGTNTSITYSVGTVIEYNEVFNTSGLNSEGAVYVRIESDFSAISSNFDIDAENIFVGYVSSANGVNLPISLNGTTYVFTPRTKQIKLDKEDLMNNLKQGLLDLRNVLYTNTHSIPGDDIVITSITPSNYDVTKDKNIVAQTSTNTTIGNINMIVMDSNNVGILNILKCF